MKKDYRKPETEITRFKAVDVITTSGIATNGNTDDGSTRLDQNFNDLFNEWMNGGY